MAKQSPPENGTKLDLDVLDGSKSKKKMALSQGTTNRPNLPPNFGSHFLWFWNLEVLKRVLNFVWGLYDDFEILG